MPFPLFRIVILGLAMFAGGWLGMAMAVPPGYASPLWPPTGIALAALLTWGRRLWPGVLLGAIANQFLAVTEYSAQLTLATLCSSLLIASASTLQALAASWLSARWVQPGLPRLDSPRSILIFFLLTAPLACLIAATVGVSTLMLLGVMPLDSAAMSWWNWWVGDSLGVLIIAPLAFCVFGQPGELWKKRRISVALPLLATLLALIGIFIQVFRAEQQRVQQVFDGQAANIARLFEDYAGNVLDSTLNLQDLYAASKAVERREFASFSQPMLARHPEIQALEWLPRVPYEALQSFEKSVREEGYPDFRVFERDAHSQPMPVQKRAEYFPVTFVEPMQGNEKAFGFDSLATPLSKQSKQAARDSGKPSVSQRLELVQTPEPGVLLSIPVYKNLANADASGLAGFVSAVVLPSRLVQAVIQGINTEMLGITLYDISASTNQSELYSKPIRGGTGQHYLLKAWQQDFLFADRSWRIAIRPDAAFMVAHSSTLPWLTLIGGLCFTSLLSVLLLTISGRTAQIEALVDARTCDLANANAELKTVASELQSSEAKLRTLIQAQPECVKLLDRNGTLLEMNQAGLELIGADSLDQVSGTDVSKLVLPKYRQAFLDSVREVFAGGSVTLEFEIKSLKGVHRWLDTHAVPLHDSEGSIVALLAMTRDISTRKQLENTLRQNEQKLNNILDNLNAYIYVKDRAGRYLYVNRLVCELWRTTADQIIGRGDEKFFDPETNVAIKAVDRRVLDDGETIRTEETNLVEHTGKMASYWSTKMPLRNESGEIYALLGISTDITERKQAEESLKLAARVFGEAHEGILITDARANIVDVNPTFCEITGYGRDEVIGKNPSLLQSGRHSAEFYKDMWQTLISARHWQGEVWNRKKNGEMYAELLTISALCDERGDILYFVGLFSDITQSKQQQQMLEILAHYDPLTRLPNRTLFADRLQQAIAHSKRDKSLLAICFLDLDGFKPVNDQFGHDAGDRILIEVAERIKNSVREEDSVSRHGGDEFALLLGDLHSLQECEQAITRIHQAIAAPYYIESQALSIGVSSGITVFPLDDADSDTLLRHADHAMYQAKLAGKNRYQLFDASLDQLTIDRNAQLREIEAAFEDRQFCLYYQPKVNIRTGRVTGVEALIRWLHPQRGMVPPLDFLPILASSELEIRIGNWVIETAWQQLVAWHRQGLSLEVSVNISAYHLLWSGFTRYLESVMAESPEITTHYFQLEILESTALDDLSAVNRVIKTCRNALGVTASLDDFGTGYSSLTHLRHLPVDTVKIDKSFVRDMLDDPDDYAIVESVIGLSHAFNREVVAEGVEQQEQGTVLLLLGCQLAQGYAIAKPMPAGELPEWMDHYRPFADWLRYASLELDAEQTQIAIRRIDLRQWLEHVRRCLEDNHNNRAHWPCMNTDKSHFGRWAGHAQLHQQFNPNWLAQLLAMHRTLLEKANVTMQLFWEGETEQARAGFTELEALYRQLDQMLSEYD